jgi:hypothetical protein
MTDEERKALEKAKADAEQAARDLEKARQDAKDAKTEGEKLVAQTRADQAELAKLRAENEALKLQQSRTQQEGQSTEARIKADSELGARVEEMISLRQDAKMAFSTPTDPEAKAWKADGKSPDQVRLEIIAHLEPKLRLDGIKAIPDEAARSAALKSVYETVIGHKRATDQARADAAAAAAGERRDGSEGGDDEDEDDKEPDANTARKAMVKRIKGDWKKKSDRKPGKRV